MENLKGFIQSVKTSPWHISLRVRNNGQTFYLLISRGKKAELLRAKSEIPLDLRVSDKVKEKFNNELKNSFLFGVENQDNFIVLTLLKNKESKLLFCCFCDRKMIYGFAKKGKSYLPYLVQPSNDSILSADEIYSREKNRILKKFNPMEVTYTDIESYKNYVGYEAIIIKDKSKQEKKLNKKKRMIENDLVKLTSSRGIKESLASGKLDHCFKQGSFEHGSIKIKYRKGLSYFQNRDVVFNKLKAYESAIKIQEKRLKSLGIEYSKIDNLINKEHMLYPANSIISDNNSVKSQIGAKYIGPDQVILLIGRNGKENNVIRKYYSNKDDVWFHEASNSGPHGFLRLCGNKLEIKYLDFVGSVFCKIEKKQSIKLIYTRVRNLRSTKGKAGLIIPTKSKEYEYLNTVVR